jgi:hypothetical protein
MCGIAEKLYQRRDEIAASLPDDPEAGIPQDALFEIVKIDCMIADHGESCVDCDGVRQERRSKAATR